MNGYILSLTFLCWLLSYGPSPCQAACKVVPSSLSYSSASSKLGDLAKGVNTETVWCSGGAVLSDYKDFSPFVTADFEKNPTLVGVGLKGAPAAQKQNGYPSFQVYHMVEDGKYNAVREGNRNNMVVKTFSGMTAADNAKDEVKDYTFDHHVETARLKVIFKLKLGHDKVCIRIQFYQNPEACGEKPDPVDKCATNNGGCEGTCVKQPGSFYCTCPKGKMLWRNGLNCVPVLADKFEVFDQQLTYDLAHAQCRRKGGHLTTLFSTTDQSSLVAQITQPKNPYFLGVVDVDHDQTYARWVDGSDLVYEAFQRKRTNPGSTGLFLDAGWTFNQQRQHMYSCRITKQDSYLLSGYHGVADLQLTSSPSLLVVSAVSGTAFGPPSGRRGSREYLTADSGRRYGAYWTPKPTATNNKFLQVKLNSENEITGVTVIGFKCTSTSVKFRISYKTFDQTSRTETKEYSTSPESESLIFITPHLTATEIAVKITDDTVCAGYQWDLTGRPTGRRLVDECQTLKPCSHQCVDTPESFFCQCPRGYHLFIDEKTCLPDTKPIIEGPELLTLEYPEFKDVYRRSQKPPTYYQFYPEEKSYSEAQTTCRKYGGYLLSIHSASEQRLLLPKLKSHPTCTKWFLGLNGSALMHNAWHDGSWVDFALFDGPVPEKRVKIKQLVTYLDKERMYLWTFGPPTTTRGCFVCQYEQRDCNQPILLGLWPLQRNTIGQGTWNRRRVIVMIRNLLFGTNFFSTNRDRKSYLWVMVIFGLTFKVHALSCSTKFGLKVQKVDGSGSLPFKFTIRHSMSHVLYIQSYKEDGKLRNFDCGPIPYVYKTHHLKSPFLAQYFSVNWEYDQNVVFTISLQLYGCPAYTSVKKTRVNAQCGTQPSMVSMTSPRSYTCMYSACELAEATCSPYGYYHAPAPGHACSASDRCAATPCDEGTVCLDLGTTYECHCPLAYDGGNCTYISGMYVAALKSIFRIDFPVTLYAVLKNEEEQYKYYVDVSEITEKEKHVFSCRPTFGRRGKSMCSEVKYRETHLGNYQVRLRLTDGSAATTVSTYPSKFSVLMASRSRLSLYRNMKLNGTSGYLQAKDLNEYKANTFLKFSLYDFEYDNSSWQYQYNWTLRRSKLNVSELCHDEVDDYAAVEVPQQKQSRHFEVPEFALADGYYKLCSGVTIKVPRLYTRKKSACGYFRIVVFPLKVVMVPSTSHLAVPNHRPVVLNASASFDPNVDKVPTKASTSNITFHWYCLMQPTNNTCDFLSRAWPSFVPDPNKPNLLPVKGSVLQLKGRVLTVNQTYLLMVKASKPNVPEGNASVTITSEPSDHPVLDIRCIFNCKKMVNPTEILALELDCENCELEGIRLTSYVWRLTNVQHGLVPFSVWKPHSTTGNNHSSLVLQAYALNTSSVYVYELTVRTHKGIASKVEYRYKTNTPPRGGSCTIDPSSGRALFTLFKVTCSGFLDDDLPLAYSIYINSVQKQVSLFYHGVKSTSTGLTLPQGKKEHDFNQTLMISIEDSLETKTLAVLIVQVLSPKENEKNSLKLLEEFTKNITSPNYDFEYGDFLTMAKSIVMMLAEEESTTKEDQEMESTIREELMGSLNNYGIKSKFNLYRMSDIVDDIISQVKRLSKRMEKLAMEVTAQLVEPLLKISKKSPTLSRLIGFLQFHTVDLIVSHVSMESKGDILDGTTTESPATTTATPVVTTKSPEERAQLKKVMKHFLRIFEKIGDAMLNSIQSDAEDAMHVKSEHAAMCVKWSATRADDVYLAERVLARSDVRGAFAMPLNTTFSKINQEKNSSLAELNIQTRILQHNPYVWSLYLEKTNLPVLQVVIKERGKREMLKLSQLSIAVDVFISVNFTNLMRKEETHILYVSYSNQKVLSSNAMVIAIPPVEGKTNIVRIYSKNTSLKLQVLVGTPDLEVNIDTIEQQGYTWPIPKDALLTYKHLTQDPELLFLSPSLLGANHTNYTVGVRVKSGQSIEEDLSGTGTFAIEFGVHTFTAQCSYWSEKEDEWRTDGCVVSPFTTLGTLHCWCDHLTSFTGGVFVMPNTVNPVKDIYLFLTFFDNPVVVTVIVAVWILYFMLMYWAHRVDYEDLQKTGVTVLPDSVPANRYLYLVCVVTGWWHDAGTTSKVFAYICGRHGFSERHALYDSERKLFSSGAEDWFLLKTGDSLGKIQSVIIWHDNSGHKPSWFLKEVVVMDLQTNETWHCLFDDWLSLGKGHKTITAEIPSVEGDAFASRYYYQFSQTSSQNFRSGHLWISIFSKPPTSTFTRKQRLTCALNLLVSTMLVNLMFLGIPRDDPREQVDYGDFHLSLVDFVIGMESSLIMFPVNLLVVSLFTQLEPRYAVEPVCVARVERVERGPSKVDKGPSEVEKGPAKVERGPAEVEKGPAKVEKGPSEVEKGPSAEEHSSESTGSAKQPTLIRWKNKKIITCRLPWYFIYVAYSVSITISLICSFFVMLYGLKYGYHRSVSWLISFVTAFFQNAFVMQPAKVLLMAFLVTLLLKQPVQYKSGVSKKQIDENEEYLDKERLKREGIFVDADDQPNELDKHYMPPLPRSVLRRIRKRIILDQRTREILIEIVMYFSFVAIELLVVLGHTDATQAFHVTKGVHDVFVEAAYGDDGVPFYDVSDSESLLEFVNWTLLANLMSDSEGNAMYQDSVEYLVGRARLRQIRIQKKATCIGTSDIEYRLNASHKCLQAFTLASSDTQSYTKNWHNITNANESTMWTYHSGIELRTLPIMGKIATYPGGGYVLQFPRNPILAQNVLKDMQNSAWIDEYTRAVFVEFTLFNPNVHLFTVVVLMFEFSNTGFVYPYHQIYTANFYHYQNEFETFVAGCEVLFVLYIVTFTYWEAQRFRQVKWKVYFSDTWNVVEVIILGLSYCVLGLFINRLIICSHLMSNFSDSDFEKFVSFYAPAFFDAVLRYVMGVLNLVTIIKFFKLLRFNVRLSTLAQTLSYAKGKLLAYCIGLIGITMAFAQFALLLFGYTLEGYRNFTATIISMFVFMLGESDYYGLLEGDAILGPAFFFLFSLTFQFIFVQYFVTLLMDAFNKAVTNLATMKTEVHMVQYIMRKLYLLIMLDTQKANQKKKRLL